jgi:nucleoid-associated protein YgaU
VSDETVGPPVRTYTVMVGDSLSKIAASVYGRPSDWRKIYEANRDRIKSPDTVAPGLVLNIPD